MVRRSYCNFKFVNNNQNIFYIFIYLLWNLNWLSRILLYFIFYSQKCTTSSALLLVVARDQVNDLSYSYFTSSTSSLIFIGDSTKHKLVPESFIKLLLFINNIVQFILVAYYGQIVYSINVFINYQVFRLNYPYKVLYMSRDRSCYTVL